VRGCALGGAERRRRQREQDEGQEGEPASLAPPKLPR
jgi:hypothetical protein